MSIPGMPEGVEVDQDKLNRSIALEGLRQQRDKLKQACELAGLDWNHGEITDPMQEAVSTGECTLDVNGVLNSAADNFISLCDELGYHVRVEHAKNPLQTSEVLRTVDFWPCRIGQEGGLSDNPLAINIFPSYKE